MRLEEMDAARWTRVFATNVIGASSARAKRCVACPRATAGAAAPS